MTTVIHHRQRQPYEAPFGDGTYVYCGRPTKYGNPYVIGHPYPRYPEAGEPMTRADVVALYRVYFYLPAQIELRQAALRELVDKHIGCWCKPHACHLDVVAAWVNSGGTLAA